MDVVVQRGPSRGKRNYGRDVVHTIGQAIDSSNQSAIAGVLHNAGYSEYANDIQETKSLHLWGGPRGIANLFQQTNAGDLFVFIVDDAFRFVTKIDSPLKIDEGTARRVARLVWEQEDYPYIWTLNRVHSVEVWRRQVGA